MSIAFCTDLETVAKDSAPTACTATSDIVQIAAVPVDLQRLEIWKDDAINIVVKPPEFNSKTFEKDHSQVIRFHCKHLGKSQKELMEYWSMGVKEEEALKQFAEYLKEVKGKSKGRPAFMGHNSKGFDEPILKRKYKTYGKAYPFAYKGHIDTMDVFSWYFRYAHNPPKNHKLDTVLPHLGISNEGSHDALIDVFNTAEVAVKFLRVQKTLMSQDQGWVHAINGSKALGAS